MEHTKINLNESLFMEDAREPQQVPQDTIEYVFQGTELQEVSKSTMDIIQNPYKEWGTDPYTGKRAPHVMKKQAFMLLRLYELTMVNPNNPYAKPGAPYTDPYLDNKGNQVVFDPAYGIKRSDILRMAGVANPDEPGEASTDFGDFKHAGLAYLGENVGNTPGYVYPGSRLEPYIHGALDASWNAQALNRTTKQMEPFTNNVDMSGDIGKLPDRPRKTPSASKTRNPGTSSNPFANIPGIKVVPPKKTAKELDNDDPFENIPKAEPVQEAPIAEEPVKEEPITTAPEKSYRKFDLSRFKKRAANRTTGTSEHLELVDEAFLLKDQADLIERAKSAYRSWRGLNEDADITDEYNTYDFKALCCCNKWPVDLRKQIWPGRDFS